MEEQYIHFLQIQSFGAKRVILGQIITNDPKDQLTARLTEGLCAPWVLCPVVLMSYQRIMCKSIHPPPATSLNTYFFLNQIAFDFQYLTKYLQHGKNLL